MTVLINFIVGLVAAAVVQAFVLAYNYEHKPTTGRAMAMCLYALVWYHIVNVAAMLLILIALA